jgi:hypothetical protein
MTRNSVRTTSRRISFCITLPVVLLFLPTLIQADTPNEPYKFFREFAGLNEEQITAIRSGKAVAKVVESPTPDEVYVFGSVYVEATPESYIKLASDIDALRKLLAISQSKVSAIRLSFPT